MPEESQNDDSGWTQTAPTRPPGRARLPPPDPPDPAERPPTCAPWRPLFGTRSRR